MSAIKDKLAKGMQKSKDAVTGTPAIKIKIREATSNKSWGPTGQQLQELARCSFHYSSFGIIMHKIWKRLNDHGKNWRHIYKALLVLDYLIKNGSKQVIVDARQHLPNIQTLTTYQHIDTSDNDVGQSVRERSRAIIELLNDPERLAEEREKAKHNRGKYTDSMGSEVSRRATRSRDEDDDFESKGDDYRGGRGASPSYAKRGGVNSPRPGRKDSDEDEDIPKPEPLPQEWLADSQENMSITYNTDREAKPHKSPVPRSKPRKAQATPGQAPPDLKDKAEQLKEMFVGLTTEDAIKILRKCNYSISDAALRLSDPHRMSKYTGQQQQQQQQRQQQAKEQRKPRAPTLESTNTAPGAGGSLLTDPVVGMQNLSIGAQGSGSFAPAFYGSGVGLSQAQPQPGQIQAYPYAQPAALQQQSSFVAQPASAGSPYGSMPRTQPQPPLSGSFSPAAPLGSAPSGSAQTQGWTSFGTGTPGLYGSSASASVASSNSSIAAASPQQQPQQPQAAYFAQQQQQLQQQQLQLQQQQQQLQQQIQQQQLQLQQQLKQQQMQQQQATQPPLSSGGGAFQPLQYPQQGTTPQAVFTATPQPYGSSSAPAVSYTAPGSPLQYPQSPQLQQQQLALQQQLYQQALASQSQLAQSPWAAGQQAPLSGGFTPFGQVAAAPQSSGLYGSSSFQPSQSQPQQQQQTSTDAFASLVAQQLPKGAQLQSLSPTTPQHQPEPKKTLAQLQSYPAYFQAGQQLPTAPQQVGNGQNPFGQQDFF